MTVIDVHTHAYTREWYEIMREHGVDVRLMISLEMIGSWVDCFWRRGSDTRRCLRSAPSPSCPSTTSDRDRPPAPKSARIFDARVLASPGPGPDAEAAR